VANIHVARHVDIDGIGRDIANASDDDLYLNTVNNARLLVRTLEAAMQSLYDDGSTFLITAQAICLSQSRQEDDASRDYLDAIAICMKANLDVVSQSLEALLAVGHDQADFSQGDYNGSIEWRMSRLSVTPTQSDRTHRPGSSISVVDMAIAFSQPIKRSIRNPKGSISSFNDGSTLNGTDTASVSTAAARSETPTNSDKDIDSLLDELSQSQNSQSQTCITNRYRFTYFFYRSA
jgi:son of sevenless-like protein